jgi:hypothetical protein
VVEVEVVEATVVEVEVAVEEVEAGTVRLVFDLKAVNRHEPPHLEYASPAQAMLQSPTGAAEPPTVLPHWHSRAYSIPA